MQQEGGAANANSFSSGFVSVKSNYGKIMQEQEEKRMLALDKRAAEQQKVIQDQVPKGRKRQIEGQGTIASFFGKKPRTGEANVTTSQIAQQPPPASISKTSSAPLRDVSNINKPLNNHPLSSKPLSSLHHRVRAAPLVQRRPVAHSRSDPTVKPDSGYVFLSSPPPQPEEEDDPEPAEAELPKVTASHTSSFKPASTFHSTSMNNIPTQRRTLGIGKMKPWSARGGKR
jgi:DNA helicase-2/ATP-dependent DNA helicase PcrA